VIVDQAGRSRTCVFCASSELPAPLHALARSLGAAIAATGDDLVYGGTTTGLMGAVSGGARDAGGRVVGYVPQTMVASWLVDDTLDQLVVVATMGERKDQMLAGTHRVVVLPGGLGTLDELFEVMTYRQLGYVPAEVDIVLLDPDDLYAPLLAQLDALIALGTVQPVSAALRVARTVTEALAG
jgi:uncharacterized protein (TIGR00730 family)